MNTNSLINRASDVSKNLDLLLETCKEKVFNVTASILCSILTGPVREMKTKIDEKLSVVFDLVRPNDAKQRRGLINGLGTVIKAITGNMDAADAENIYADINLIRSDQNKLKDNMKNQLQIVESALEIFNNASKTVQDNENALKAYIDKVRDTLTSKFDRDTARQHMDEALTAIAVAVEALLDDVEELVRIVTEVSSGKVNAAIITPQKLAHYLADALPHLPPGSGFPVAIHRREMTTLLRLTDTKAYSSDNVITLILEIPLIGQEKYSVSKVYPVPIRSDNNSYYFIDTTEDLVAINRENQRFLQITETELKKCKNIQKSYICKPSHPSVKLSSAAPCEVLTFAEMNIDNSLHCLKRAISLTRTLIVTMRQPGRWIYISPVDEPISVACDKYPLQHATLRNSGILALTGICTVTAQEFYVKTIQKYTQTVDENYLPNYNLTLTSVEKKISKTVNEDLKIKTILRNPEELKVLGIKLTHSKNELDTINNQNVQYYHNIGSYSLGTIAPIALICYAVYKWRKRKPNTTPTGPAPPVIPATTSVESIDTSRAEELRAELSRVCPENKKMRLEKTQRLPWKWNV